MSHPFWNGFFTTLVFIAVVTAVLGVIFLFTSYLAPGAGPGGY